jgi:hypothetical protein
VAAYIAGAVALAVAAWNVGWARRQSSRDVTNRRFDSAQDQRRVVYAAFIESVETLVDRLDRHVAGGQLAFYLGDTKERANPLPDLAEIPGELERLTKLGIAARTQRVMVEITGPSKVGEMATDFERSADGVSRGLADRDAQRVHDETAALRAHRTAFVAAATAALSPSATPESDAIS